MKTLRIAVLATLAAVASTAVPAGAQAPTAGCFGLAAKDKAGDQTPGDGHPNPSDDERKNLDILETFFTSSGSETVANFRVTDMHTTVPEGSTAITWYLRATVNGDDTWFRAMADYTGLMTYEYGHFMAGFGAGPQEYSIRDGSASGAIVEGANGVVSVTLPADGPGASGNTVKTTNWTAYEAVQVLPGASPTAVKGGLLYEVDIATGKYEMKLGSPCPATPPGTPPPTSPGPGGPQPMPVGSGEPLPVTVLTKKTKRGKSMSFKVRASQEITKVGARLLKGKKTVASSKMIAKLSGTKTLKLKAKRKPKKGKYALEIAGTDSSGARRFTAAKVTLR